MEADVWLDWSDGYRLYRAWIGGQTTSLKPAVLDGLAIRSQVFCYFTTTVTSKVFSGATFFSQERL